ncbi:MAG: sulfatase [Verrucomicrobiota bacterium]|nr:sulfatase [Verrucomicrobiota bacterium]
MIYRCLILLLLSITGQAADQPNVLFIVVDDLRASVGILGDQLAKTPQIDALGQRGIVFTNAHCQIAICNPSRASVMTGMRPDTLRVWGLKKHFREEKPNVVTLPQLFKQNGYHTHSIGKIFHGSGKPSKDPLSWSEQPELDSSEKKEQYRLLKNRTGGKASAAELAECHDNDYIDGKVADAAIRKLRQFRQRDQPFFLAVGFRKPHMPFSAPAKYWAIHDRAQLGKPRNPAMPQGAPSIAAHNWREARGYNDIPNNGPLSDEKIAELRHGYYAATSYTDAQLGRVLDELKRLGLEQTTVISLYSDHGFHVGEHNLWGKLTNYDVGTRVPLLFVAPSRNTKGRVVRQAVELLDLYPTLADLCSLKKPTGLEGKSLLPQFDNNQVESTHFALSQFPRPVSYDFSRGNPKNMGYSVRTDRYRYTQWIEFKSGAVLAEEFYDYTKNEWEKVNLINVLRYAEIIEELRHRLEDRIRN